MGLLSRLPWLVYSYISLLSSDGICLGNVIVCSRCRCHVPIYKLLLMFITIEVDIDLKLISDLIEVFEANPTNIIGSCYG